MCRCGGELVAAKMTMGTILEMERIQIRRNLDCLRNLLNSLCVTIRIHPHQSTDLDPSFSSFRYSFASR